MSARSVAIQTLYHALFDGPHATPKPSEDGPVYLGIGNITEDGKLDLTGIRHISEEDYPGWTKRVTPQPGDIVFTYEATLNRYALIPEGFRGCLGRRTALIRPNAIAVNPRFLFFYFFSEAWRKTIEQNILSGATVDRIPLTKFPCFPVTLPERAVQDRIASILSAYDDLIENNTRRIKILDEMARMIYREWFVDFRFPGHENARMVESEVGPIPEGWSAKRVIEAVLVNPTTKVSKEGVKPFVPMASLSDNSMLVSDIEYREGNSGSKFKNGDTLFARITPCLENGKTGFIQFLPSDDAVAFGSTEFIILRSNTLCPEYVYLMARSSEFRDNAIKSMSGATGRQRVQEACFDRLVMAQPSERILDRFRAVLSPMFRLIQSLHLMNSNLRATRDLLLPRLISGEIPVAAAGEAMEQSA